MKLHIASDDHEHAILVGDEDHNDIAEFFHSDHATVAQSYETALMLARKLVDDGASPVKAAPSDIERAFTDAYDEAECAYDNEALLQAIHDLKTVKAAPVARPSVNEYASNYEYRGDQDYVPTEGECAMIEDAIEGYLSLCETALAASHSPNSEVHQNRGRHYDIILEAISNYDEWMLDDDYNPQITLDRIIKRMRERLDMSDPPPPSREVRACDFVHMLRARAECIRATNFVHIGEQDARDFARLFDEAAAIINKFELQKNHEEEMYMGGLD
ncbi:hypothetical protein [Sphingomonas sp.]|uniref:hypothetical protein n=1 Tax=Sphingomonas sp. TaxID=28214 RepID=UPI0025CED50F|nr:hypothetical protein [Sphingomonas sp.]